LRAQAGRGGLNEVKAGMGILGSNPEKREWSCTEEEEFAIFKKWIT
jgi:hypothetical protein